MNESFWAAGCAGLLLVGCVSGSTDADDQGSLAGAGTSAAGSASAAGAGHVGGAAGSTSGGASSVVGGGATGTTGPTGPGSSGGTGSAGASSGGAPGGTAGAPGTAGSGMLGAVAYREDFDALSAGLWKKNLDGSKIKAHPENAQVTPSCGPDGSSCLRVVYRHPDGIHKQPNSSPIFDGSGSDIAWAASDAGHTNTSTDVIQANIGIDGSSDGKSSASSSAVPSKAYTLSYDVYFEPGFDFAKGGKLPGLAAAEFDSGCTEDGNDKRQPANWSERLMWRANGRLQLYSYDQSRPSGNCGIETTIDAKPGDPQFELPGTIPNDDKFRLKPGVWYTVQLSVRVNDNDSVTYQMDSSGHFVLDASGYKQPLSGNGAVSLLIRSADGSSQRALDFENVALRDECDGACASNVPDSKKAWVNALFFSTFFGGNETKRTTCIDSAKSTLSSVAAQKMPSYPGLTQPAFDALCTSQMNAAIYPKLTWDPQTPSAARFDNFEVRAGFVSFAP